VTQDRPHRVVRHHAAAGRTGTSKGLDGHAGPAERVRRVTIRRLRRRHENTWALEADRRTDDQHRTPAHGAPQHSHASLTLPPAASNVAEEHAGHAAAHEATRCTHALPQEHAVAPAMHRRRATAQGRRSGLNTDWQERAARNECTSCRGTSSPSTARRRARGTRGPEEGRHELALDRNNH
jgi:hypothetical protein